MKKYIVGARNNSKDNYTVVIRTNFKWLALFVKFFTEPFVNEIKMVNEKDVIIIKKTILFDEESFYLKN